MYRATAIALLGASVVSAAPVVEKRAGEINDGKNNL